MPIINKSTYPGPPFFLINGHLETLYPAFVLAVPDFQFQRERLELEDGDFVDLDWRVNGNSKLIILSHGLEGNSGLPYMRRAADFFFNHGWDILAWNCRSCSGELNRNQRIYYHGDTEDIRQVVDHLEKIKSYEEIVLVGYSMGGNISLKYAGTHPDIPASLKCVVAISAPCDLEACAETLNYPSNRLFKKYFFKKLKEKILRKAAQFPGVVDLANLEKIEVWQDFDRYFSAPINGFDSAEAFYHSGSARHFLDGIKIPSLILNAANDPILAGGCYPHEICESHPYVFLETPDRGGHVGFSRWERGVTWMEYRVLEFVNLLKLNFV